MKNIIFTGGNGMLGSAFQIVLENNSDYSTTFLTIDDLELTNSDAVEEYFNNNACDILINCAAYTQVDQAETDEAIAFKVNGDVVGHLSKLCKEKGIVFVNYSTDYVFDGENKDGYSEDAEVDPLNAYGRSKAIGEKLLKENGDKYYNIRTQWLYGPKGKNFVDTIINAFKEGKNLKIVNDQFGSPTYTLDLAKKTLDIIEKNEPYGFYHVTNTGVCSWHEFTEYFLKIFNNSPVDVAEVSSDEFPRPAKRPHYSALINNKTESMRSWKEAVEEYVKTLSNN
ncbi:MAG: dTDP-4-dehydrorhamnose reductase [bacterium]